MKLNAAFLGSRHVHTIGVLRGMLACADDLNFCGIWEPATAAREKVLQHIEMPVFESIENLVEAASPDLLIIAGPNGDKEKQILAALKQGIHVVCPKPMAITQAVYGQIKDVLQDSNVQLLAATPLRYHPFTWPILRTAQDGLLGKVVSAHIELPHKFDPEGRDPYFFDPELYGGIGLDIGWNVIDFMTCLLKEPVVQAHGFRGNAMDYKSCGFQDHLQAAVRFAGGASCTFDLDWLTPPTAVKGRKFILKGTHGCLEAVERIGDIKGCVISCTTVENGPEVLRPAPEEEIPSPFKDFVSSIISGKPRSVVTHEQLFLSMENLFYFDEKLTDKENQ